MSKVAIASELLAMPESGRRLKSRKQKRQELRRQAKQARANAAPLPSGFRVLSAAIQTLAGHWKLFGGIVLMYIVLNLLLAQSVAGLSTVPAMKQLLEVGGQSGHLAAGGSLFVYLLGTAATNGGIVNVYQPILTVIVSLAIIWALRQLQAKQPVRIRDGFYRGMFPFIPFILVLLVIGAQLVPMAAGGALYGITTNSGVSATWIEEVLFGAVFVGLSALSLYWITSSVFALYIVCLPDMMPRRALRAARQLVRFRRWAVMRKVLFLPLVLLVGAGAIMVPLIIFATPVAGWAFFLLSMAVIALVHSYLYTLYRSLL